MGIPFIDLQSQYQRIQSDVEEAVLRVLRSGQYILGPDVGELEKQLAAYAGTKHCVTCASGTDALMIALMAHNVGPGDAVFVPTFTFFATAEVVSLLGATPIFVDVRPDSFNLCTEKLAAAIQAVKDDNDKLHPLPRGRKGKLKARGIIAVDLFGQPAEYEKINALANDAKLFVIEDAAQSFGGESHGKRAGSLAATGCTSFFPAKPLGCYGDGGALFTDDDAQLELLRSIRVHGQGTDRYENVRLGITGRLDSVQAAVLISKLKIFPDEVDARDRIAKQYNQLIGQRAIDLVCPQLDTGMRSAWAQYSVLARDADHRKANQESLQKAGIPSMIYYPKPLHLQKAFADLDYRAGDFPVSEHLAQRIFSLPMHPYLSPADQEAVVAALV